VNDFNAKMLQKMKKNITVFDFVNTADVNDAEENHDELTMKYLQSLSSAELSSAQLCLKMKAFIILLQNLNFSQRLCNRTHMTVTHLE